MVSETLWGVKETEQKELRMAGFHVTEFLEKGKSQTQKVHGPCTKDRSAVPLPSNNSRCLNIPNLPEEKTNASLQLSNGEIKTHTKKKIHNDEV